MQLALLSWETRHSISVGGVAAHVSDLAAALMSRGHDVHVFTRRTEQQAHTETIDGVVYHRCDHRLDADFPTEIRHMCHSFIGRLRQVEGYLGRKFELIHGHDWLCVPALITAKNELGRPVVLTMHSSEFGRCGNQLWEGTSRRVRDLEWEGAYVANEVICVSGALRRELQWLYGVPWGKMHVIYNGVHAQRFDSTVDTRGVRWQYAVDEHDPLILFSGRITWQKGPDLLLESMPRVLHAFPQAKVVYVGEGDMRTGLERRAAELGIARSARFVGFRSGQDLVSLYHAANIVCVPSRNEPFGIVILEAWSASKPVVTTRNGGPAEFVRNRDTGLTVADNAWEIGEGLRTALADRDNLQRMGRNGRREAEGRFSWDAIAVQTEGVYSRVLGGAASIHGDASTPGEQPPRLQGVHDGAAPGCNAAGAVTGREIAGDKSSRGEKESKKMSKSVSNRRPSKAQSKPVADVMAMPEHVAAGAEVCSSAEIPCGAASFEARPTEERIRQRAHEIFLARNGAPGDPMADWLKAEQEIRAEMSQETAKSR